MYKFSILLLLSIFSTTAQAGGISGGGGGTTSPVPVAPAVIEKAIKDYGGPMLLAWVKGAERSYRNTPTEKKRSHPFVKLFAGPVTIYDVIAQAKVELRYHTPCYDRDGLPRDGSVESGVPGGVCLSPFTMAPKLGETTVNEETLALLLHELSHQLGTTEEEATAIQVAALASLHDTNLPSAAIGAHLAHSWIEELRKHVEGFVTSGRVFRTKHLYEVGTSFQQIYQQVFIATKLSHLRPRSANFLIGHDTAFQAMGEYLCASDEQEADEVREACRAKLDRGFGEARETTVKEYLARLGTPIEYIDPEAGEIFMPRFQSQSDVKGFLKKLSDFWGTIALELRQGADTQIEIISR